ncbi:MAG TPA: TetR/AcrR family transcriptional regulator [Nitrospiraceae bacterium]|nr:TetR/AcrR family transcriptional regulator [Nitrospiraceae bacterium]
MGSRKPSIAPSGPSVAQRVVAAARHQFMRHGFRHVTMDELASELGMSKKTLYACFPSKVALLEAVLLDKFRSVEADLDGITSDCSSDVLSALHRLLACMQRHTEEIQPPFVRDMRRESPELFKIVENRRRDVIQRHFGKILGEGRRAGIIRKDIPATLIMEILLGAVQAIMNPPKMAELALTPKTGYATIMKVVLEGVMTEAGRPKL